MIRSTTNCQRNVRWTVVFHALLLLMLLLSHVSAIDTNRFINDEEQNEHRFLIFTRSTQNRFIDWIRRIFKKKKQPTLSPTTKSPTTKPSKVPTKMPSKSPTKIPTKAPTKIPTKAPTKIPTKAPTKIPTNAPTKLPTKAPTTASLQVACNFLGLSSLTTCQSTTAFFAENDAIGTTIPTEIGLLTQLTYLSLYNEGLSSTIPSTISALTKLIILDLGLNQLNNTIPLFIGEFINIKLLGFDNNQLIGSLPSTLNRLTALQHLNLYNNPGLSGSIPSIVCTNTFAGINKVIYIDCGRNITCNCCRSGQTTLEC